ncbi:hypothetical protein Lal_00039968, partial [Lupinus albus]
WRFYKNDPYGSGLIPKNQSDRTIHLILFIPRKKLLQQSLSQNHGPILLKFYVMDENHRILKPDLYSNIVLNPFHLYWHFPVIIIVEKCLQ